jgi:hypothetical protein
MMFAKSGTLLLLLGAQTVFAVPAPAAHKRLLLDINLTNDVWVFDAPAFQDPATGSIMANFQALVLHRGIGLTSALLAPVQAAMRLLGVDDTDGIDTLKERLEPFGAVGISGKQINLSASGCATPITIGKTASLPDLGLMQVSVDIGKSCGAGSLAGGAITVQADMGDSRTVEAKIFPSGPTGFGVISDIDDTIKVSEVLDKVKLLQNTFFKDAEPVAGMPELYSTLNENLDNPPFFYVSGSPFQLYPFLHPFVNANFPPGPLLMKNLTASITAITNFIDSEATKTFKLAMIARINGFYPKKNFLLIGDSTEKDPETFGEAFRVHGAEFVKCIWVREVDGAANTAERFAAAFDQVPTDKFRTFKDPSELAGIDVAAGEC